VTPPASRAPSCRARERRRLLLSRGFAGIGGEGCRAR
jgi:hypothetical protein